jgi:quinol monooxygenase YgiN
MAILLTTKVKGQTAEGYDQISKFLHDIVKNSPGFVLHCSYEADNEFYVLEVWNSKSEADEFFSKNVAPNIPKGVVPKRSYQELHSLVTPGN